MSNRPDSDQDDKRYHWPPQRDPNLKYREKSRHPVHSVLSALPILMLVAGLYFYYRGESQENSGAPIGSASISLLGTYTGLSATSGRHYLWIDQGDDRRGLRVTAGQAQVLEVLERGAPVSVKAAPHVQGSRTYWIWFVEQGGTIFVNDDLDTQQAVRE